MFFLPLERDCNLVLVLELLQSLPMGKKQDWSFNGLFGEGASSSSFRDVVFLSWLPIFWLV